MTVTKRVLLALVLLVGGMALVYSMKTPEEKGLFIAKGASTYTLTYTQKIFNFALSSSPTPSYVNLDAQLVLNVIDLSDKKITTTVKLQNIDLSLTPENSRLSDALKRYYQRSVKVVFGRDGHIVSMEFAGLESNYVGYRQLLQQLEVVVRDKSRYTLEQHDGLGEYKALYHHEGSVIKRIKKVYTKPVDHTQVLLYSSEATARYKADKNWFESIAFKERLRLLHGNKRLLQTETTIALKRVATDDGKRDTIDEHYFKVSKEEDSDLYQRVEHEQSESYFKAHGYTLENLLAACKEGRKMEDYTRLEQYLRLHPNEIPALYDVIAAAENDVARDLIAVMEVLQLPQSQELLTTIATDDSFTSMNRIRAIIAISGQKTLTNTLYNGLNVLVQDRHDEQTKDLSNTALLALGSISRDSNKNSVEVRETLIGALSNAHGYDAVKTALLAIENAGVSRYVDVLLPYVHDVDRRIRLRAVTMLSPFIDKIAVKDAFEAQLQEEQDKRIRQKLDISR